MLEDSLREWAPERWPVAEGWREVIHDFLHSHEGRALAVFMRQRLAAGAVIYPPTPFQALELTPLHEVRAVILGAAEIADCAYRIDDGPWLPMRRGAGDQCYSAAITWPPGARRIAVRARDAAGGEDADVVEPAGAGAALRVSERPGSDADALGAWPDKGLLGTQLGPNRNGRQW